MAIFVLALGVLMAVAGGYEIYVGSGYITIEQGWSAFISGSVLLTGGLVTIAIGLAIRVLGDLKTILIRDVRPSMVADVAVPMTDSEPQLQFPAEQPLVSVDNVPSGILVDSLTPDTVPAPPPTAPPRIGVPPKIWHPPVADIVETAPVTVDHGAPYDTLLPDVEPIPEPPPAHIDDVEIVSTPPVEPTEPSLDAPPAMDDWLDRRFADLDREVADRYPRPSKDRPVIPIVRAPSDVPADVKANEPDSMPAHRAPTGIEPTAAEFDTPSSDATEPVASDPVESAVIGRYESEGTSYVMYADGSIEAQSEAGVYRFASMAELKSFIEG